MKSRHIRRVVNFAIGFVLAVLLLWVFFKDADWAEVGRAAVEANVLLLALAFIGHVVSLVLRSWRWQILLSPVKPDLPFYASWRFLNIGFAVSSILPGRIGEVLRPYLLARDQGARFTSAFATVVTERIVDMLMVLLMLSTVFIFPGVLGPDPDHPIVATLQVVGLIALVVTVAAILFLTLLKMRTDLAKRIMRVLTRPLPEKLSDALVRIVQAFSDGIGGLRGWRQVGGLILSTLLNWFIVIPLSFWFALTAFGISVPFHFILFLLAVVALGVVVPTPAGTGTYHAAVIAVMQYLWLVDSGKTLSFAIVNHLINFSPVVIIGVFYLLRGGINIFSAADRASAIDSEPDETIES